MEASTDESRNGLWRLLANEADVCPSCFGVTTHLVSHNLQRYGVLKPVILGNNLSVGHSIGEAPTEPDLLEVT